MIDDDEVASFDLPAGTFFDAAVVHLVTTATLDRLRSLYPEGRFEPRRFRPNIIVATGRTRAASWRTTGWGTRSLLGSMSAFA